MKDLKFLKAEEGLFRGHRVYLEYCKDGLNVGQCIRVYNYGMNSGDELRFSVGLEGRLYDQNRGEVNPENVLNSEDGWGFDGVNLELLSEEVILRLVNHDNS